MRFFIVKRTESRARIDFSRNESLAERKKEKRNCFLPGYIYFIFGPLGITAFTLGFYFPPLTSINNYGQTQDYGQNTHPRVYRRKCLNQPPEEILHNVTILVVISAHFFFAEIPCLFEFSLLARLVQVRRSNRLLQQNIKFSLVKLSMFSFATKI